MAGSLRRRKSEIGDIEIVAEPKEYMPDLLGDLTETHSLDLFNWSTLGVLKLDGHKQKKIILPGDVQVDLFIVTPPAQWGVIYFLRTGSDKFSHRFVTAKSFGGCMPKHLRMQDGAIWSNNHIIPTPDEKDLFDLCGVKFIPPHEREVA
jgi:DNA polymerase/3'-5' exonuclease PolX